MTETSDWAGKRLGFPQAGPGSIAKFPRRILALMIDWGLAMLVSQAFFGGDPTATLAFYALQSVVMVATWGASFGHIICRLRVIQVSGAAAGWLKSAIRLGLILLVLPPLIWDADSRGLHDKAAGTVIVLR